MLGLVRASALAPSFLGAGRILLHSSSSIKLLPNRYGMRMRIQSFQSAMYQRDSSAVPPNDLTPEELSKYDQLGDVLMKMNRCQVDRVVPAIKKWIREGNILSSGGLARVLDRLRWRKRYLQAIMALDWVANHHIFPFQYNEAINRLDLCARCQHITRATYLFDSFPKRWKTEEAYCVLLTLFYKRNMLEEAEKLMNELKKLKGIRSMGPYHVMLSFYKSLGMQMKFEKLVEEIRGSGLALDVSFYSILLSAIQKFGGGFSAMEAVFAELRDSGLELDEVGCLEVAGIYFENGMTEKSTEVLQEVERKLKSGEFGNVRATRRKLLVMYGKLRNGDAVDRVLSTMDYYRHNMEDYVRMIQVFGAVGRMHEAEKLYVGIGCHSSNIRIHNAFLSVLVEDGLVARAEALAEHMKDIRCLFSPFTYHLLIKVYLKVGELDNAMLAYGKLRSAFKNVEWPRPSPETLAMMVEFYIESGDVLASERLIRKWMKYGFPMDVKVFNNLLKVCAKGKVHVYKLSSKMLSAGVEPTSETEMLLKQLPFADSCNSGLIL